MRFIIRSFNSFLYTDINECTNNLYNCDALSSYCVNTIGSYICACNPGYYQV